MANYYVKSTGNNANTGLSDAQAWATADKVRSTTFSTSDCVYFRCGDTFTPSDTISAWGGTSGSPNIIGAYYMDGGSEVAGVDGNRPIIDGNNYHVPSNRCYGGHNSWQGLISVFSKDYVHIKNLHIYQTGFYGIRILGNLDLGTNSAHFLVQNVKVEGAYSGGIMIINNPLNYGIIEGCEISGTSYGWKAGCESVWPAALGASACPYSHLTIRNNYVYENWGEGLFSIRVPQSDITANSGYATIEDNVVWNNRRVDIYIGRTEGNIVRRNLLLGAGPPAVNNYSTSTIDGRGWNQFGVWINAENRGGNTISTSDNSVYNNLIAGHVVGIGIASEWDSGSIENVYFYHNTVIANRVNIYIGHNLSGYTTQNVEFKNNIFWTPGDCYGRDGSESSWHGTKFVFNYNAWTAARTYQNGANDIVFDGNLTKTTGWQALTAPIDAENFRILTGCNCIGAGVSV